MQIPHMPVSIKCARDDPKSDLTQKNIKNMTALLLVILGGAALLLFTSVDVGYFVTSFWIALRTKLLGPKQKITKESDIFKEQSYYGRVMPSDLDYMLHMNNSKYLRKMDFGRLAFGYDYGILDIIQKHGAIFIMNAHSVRYRRSLKPFQQFVIKTRILGWKERELYMEQRIEGSDRFIYTIMYTKISLRGITFAAILKELVGRECKSPELPEEIQWWLESVQKSSEALKKDRAMPNHMAKYAARHASFSDG